VKAGVCARDIPPGIDTFFDDKILINYVLGTDISANPGKVFSWQSSALIIMGGAMLISIMMEVL